jgi:membrane-associated phospholipid phosphatase
MKNYMKGILIVFIFLNVHFVRGEDSSCVRLKTFSCFTNLPGDYASFYKREFKNEQVKKYTAIVAGTGLLWLADQAILDNTQRFGNNINVSGDDHMNVLFEITIKTKDKPISLPVNVPGDANTAMYFIGDGITHVGICLGFWTYGKIAKDYRAARTGIQIMESMLASGIATQFIKHIAGRESPFTTDVPRGVWRFFPNQKEYSNHVPRYDAFPTGHLATAVSTVTVISDNYPEWKMVKPVGYALCGLLGFAMVNNGVHWASDYPLGIALGYSFAKIVTDRNEVSTNLNGEKVAVREKIKAKPVILPAFNNGALGISAYWTY